MTLPPLDIASLTPGIRRLVGALRAAGFETTDSGDGTTNVEAGMEGAMDVPMVVVQVPPSRLIEEADRMARALFGWGVTVEQSGMDPRSPCIQASYDPVLADVGVIVLTGVDDTMIRSADGP